MERSQKGSVQVSSDKGWLRLRWTYQGKAYALPLGSPDTATNRKVAEGTAQRIQWDIQSGNFDLTLRTYRPEVEQAHSTLTSSELFNLFTKAKSKQLHPRTLEKYQAITNHLETALNGKLGLSNH